MIHIIDKLRRPSRPESVRFVDLGERVQVRSPFGNQEELTLCVRTFPVMRRRYPKDRTPSEICATLVLIDDSRPTVTQKSDAHFPTVAAQVDPGVTQYGPGCRCQTLC
eukprot:m.121621 g.121621  ORF g.121621 m.121621 type:complete len:108 (+) comp13389_c0_seq6:1382-1705(+)